MATLSEIVKQSVFEYAGGGFKLQTFPLLNEEKQVYGVVMVDSPIREQEAAIMLLARVADDYVVIEEDNTDKPLWRVLEARGIPKDKIIRVYAGEHTP
jgi:hypothetical protein